MERGILRTVGGYDAGGSIGDAQGLIVYFDSSGFVGRNRSGAKVGDAVFFERIGTHPNVKAINVRLCNL